MPSLADSAFIFVLALLLFGPKKLPELARQIGKLMGEFRRASNEFRMQMEDELRMSEQEEQRKKIAAMEAAAPVTPPILDTPAGAELPALAPEDLAQHIEDTRKDYVMQPLEQVLEPIPEEPAVEHHIDARAEAAPLPIATSGDLNLMPPATGLPVGRGNANSLDPMLESIPHSQDPETGHEVAPHA
jgi:sec-independent protein translocase protein TatB